MNQLLQKLTPILLLTVMILFMAGTTKAQPLITEDAAGSFFEDFESVTMPALPQGWTARINSFTTNASITTSSLQNPHSGTQAVRFGNSTDANAVLILSTMLAQNFDSNWLTFWSKMGSGFHNTDLIIGYMSDPDDEDTFTATDTVLVSGDNYQQFRVQFNDLAGNFQYHIAFRYAPGLTNRFLYIDDVTWEQAPANPIPVIVPQQGDFGVVDLNSEKTMEFSLINHGVTTLVIQQNDISFTGENASMFSLKSEVDFPVEVEFNQGISFELAFLPTSAGEKNATLQLNYGATEPFQYNLTGQGLAVLDNYTEDFSGSAPPELPGGWSGIIESTTAAILPVSNMNPVSPPYHIRITTGADYDAVVYLAGPKVRNFQTNWLRFWARMSASAHTENIIIGTMTDRHDSQTFSEVTSVTVEGMDQQQHTVFMDPLEDTDEYYIAFKFTASDNHRTFYFDQVLWEDIPTEVVLLLDPETHHFPLRQINTVSAAQEFTITNDGPVEFSFSASDIQITGQDASEFIIVDTPQETLQMTFGDTAGFSVAFAPTMPGQKQATLQIKDQQFDLGGVSVDATISQVPHFENFDEVSTPDLPLGWGRIVYNPGLTQAHVNTITTGLPRSAPNHVSLNSNHNEIQDVMLVSPPVDNLAQKRIRFWSRASMSTNIPDLIVGTMTDAEDALTFTPFRTFTATEEFDGVYKQYVMSFDETIGDDTYIAFRHGGTPNFTRAIYIDDFLIETIPDSPVLVADTDSINFGTAQIAYATFPVTVNLVNEGAGTLSLNMQDMVFSGANAASFAVLPFPEPIEIAEFETASIAIAFNPQQTGAKSAVLTINGVEIYLEGEGIDATISQIPHTENFDQATAPELPLGWLGLAENPTLASATVEVLTTSTPLSEPNHARLFSNQNQDATVVMISPPVENLYDTRMRFYAKTNLASNAPALVIATTSNPADTSSYNVIQVIDQLTTTYQEFTIPLATAGSHTRIVFRHGGTPNLSRSIFIDDIVLEQMPDEPIIEVTPEEQIFQGQQTGTSSDPAEFVISNQGGGTLVLNPSDIEITGQDAADFILDNISQSVDLIGGASTTVSVRFAPAEVGNKIATLMIDTLAVALSGEAFDATISQFPYLETFSGTPVGQLPHGWTTDRTNWSVVNTNMAGGGAPEVRFNYTPTFNGTSHLETPEINTSEYEEMLFSFRHYLNNFSQPGIYTIKVVTIAGDNQHVLYEWVDPGNIAPEDLEMILTSEHGIGAENLRIAWIFEGNSNDINQYYINNVFLDEAPAVHNVTFNVTCTQGNAVNNAVITLGDDTNQPGDYVFEIFEGTYNYSVAAPHFETFSQQDILFQQDTTINIVLTPLTYTITFAVTDSGQDPVDTAVITFGETTNPQGNYVFENVAPGTYNWSIAADHYETLSQTGYEVSGDASIDAQLADSQYTVTFVVKDADGAALNNAVVSFAGISNPEGEYVFENITFGTWDYQVSANHYHSVQVQDVVVDQDTSINITMHPVLYDVTFSVKDQDGNHIQNAVITFGETTNPEGDYTFEGLEYGMYNYTVTAGHFQTVTVNDYLLDEDSAVDVVMTGSLYDIAFIVKNQQGFNIENAVITFAGITNPQGNYIFQDIAHGSYSLEVTAEFYDIYTHESLLVEADASIEVVLTETSYTVSFNVSDINGNAIENAAITFGDVTNPAGDYTFQQVLPGLYSWSVQAEGFETYSDDIVISNDVTIDAELSPAGYTVTFIVEDNTGASISNAVITFDGNAGAQGDYVFTNILPGTYEYTVSAEGFTDVVDTDLEVAADMSVVVVMTPQEEEFTLTLNIDMTQAEGFDALIHEVYVSGSFGGQMQWTVPGQNPQLTLGRVDDTMIYSISLQLPEGSYEYKYASNAFGDGWEGAEWVGNPNREVTLNDNLLVEDIWGVHPDFVSAPLATAASIKVFPNPAATHVNIVSDSFIKQVKVYDILGQLIISEHVLQNNHRLDVNSLKPGIYFIQLNTEKGLTTQRIQVTR